MWSIFIQWNAQYGLASLRPGLSYQTRIGKRCATRRKVSLQQRVPIAFRMSPIVFSPDTNAQRQSSVFSNAAEIRSIYVTYIQKKINSFKSWLRQRNLCKTMLFLASKNSRSLGERFSTTRGCASIPRQNFTRPAMKLGHVALAGRYDDKIVIEAASSVRPQSALVRIIALSFILS